MHGWAGFATLCVGLGVTAFAFHPGLGGGVDLADLINRPAAPEAAIGEVRQTAAPRTRLFSPQMPLFAPAGPAEAVVAAKPAGPAVAASQTVTVAAIQPVVQTAAVQPWTTVVTPVEVSKSRSSRPEGPEARAELARDLQRELKRLGCYEGEVDGSWGGGSKRAMSAFVDGVNATLPVEEPDYILLTLIKGRRDPVCGAGCPAGQAMSDGKCQPKGLIAQAARKSKSGGTGQMLAAAGTVTVEQERTVVRTVRPEVVAQHDQLVREPYAIKPAAPVIAANTSVPAAAPRASTPAPAPAVVASAAIEPLPGRMTVGGPVAAADSPRAPAVSAAEVPPAPRDNRQAGHRAVPPPSRAVRLPPPVAHHAPRPQQYVAAGGGGMSRQRSMIYNLFQRPDRTSN